MENYITIITMIGTMLSSLLGILISSKLTTYRLEQLEKKVEKHNCLVERMALAEKDIKSAHHRLDEIRGRS